MTDQLSLDRVWICDACQGECELIDPETLLPRPCPRCNAEGLLDFDPKDLSVIPF